MKKIFLALITALVIFFNVSNAQNDTMYIMKSGIVTGKYNVYTQIDSIIFYQPVIQTSNTLTDSRDSSVYQIVTIGSQVWMAENLRYLPSVADQNTYSDAISYYYVYGYDGTNVNDAKATANYSTYGVLYNWPAAMAGSASSSTNPSGVQGVCPTGWHLPSDAEWAELINYLGGESVAGSKLKETGTNHWEISDEGATNETGFTALPGGYFCNMFDEIGMSGYWWSSTEYNANKAWLVNISFGIIKVKLYKDEGFSVRCVRD